MMTYRCYFLDAEGHIHAAHEIEGESDASAIAQSRSLFLAQRALPAFELWQRNRVVHRESRPE